MQIVLFDNASRSGLFPLTLNKAVGDLRVGIFSMSERWENLCECPVLILTEIYLQPLYGDTPTGESWFIDASILPDDDLVTQIKNLQPGEILVDSTGIVASRSSSLKQFQLLSSNILDNPIVKLPNDVLRIKHPSDIFKWNAKYIHLDFQIAKKHASHDINHYDTVHLICASNIIVEEGVVMSYAILNATDGPIFIGKNVTIMEGCLLRGPISIGEGSTIKMGTKIYGGTSIGEHCVVGGEIKNSVIGNFSNKAHDGYLGDSVIGEWCNLGAGTSNSNIKNTAASVEMWDYKTGSCLNVGQKAGVVMGDYSRTSINTAINTGSVIGLACNVFGASLTPKKLQNFSWGLDKISYDFSKAITHITNWKKLKNKELATTEKDILQHIFENHKDI